MLASLLCLACDKGPALSKVEGEGEGAFDRPDLGPVDDKLLLGALSDETPIYAAASTKAPRIGLLRAGTKIARSARAHENDQCIEGWYQVAPRGYVCTEKSATIDMQHPTLLAMSLEPKLGGELPYVYARTTKVTALLSNNGQKGVALSGRLAKSTVLAVVGSWTAPDESNEPQRLGLKLDGRFVRADHLEPARPSEFRGVEVTGESSFPLGYVVRSGVREFQIEGGTATRQGPLAFHQKLDLTGRFRTVEDQKYFALSDGNWVRHKDVTMVMARHEMPEFATEGTRWLDVSIVTGTLVAYEGKKPVYATLVSVGRDRLGDPETTASTVQGTFRIVRKVVTRRTEPEGDDVLHDAPWAMLLESGQWLVATPRHDRFGVENTDGDIEVSPADGARLFAFATPELPKGWYGVELGEGEAATLVNVRK